MVLSSYMIASPFPDETDAVFVGAKLMSPKTRVSAAKVVEGYSLIWEALEPVSYASQHLGCCYVIMVSINHF